MIIPQQLVSAVTMKEMDASKRDTPAKKLFGAFFDYKVGIAKTLPFRTPISPAPPRAKDAPYKKSQRECRMKLNRATVLWTSCTTNGAITGGLDGIKAPVQGTYRRALHGPIGTGRR